jgi:hypothetical protein
VAVACCTEVVHAFPQLLQLLVSVAVSTQVEPHSVGVAAGQPETQEYDCPEPAHSGVEPLHATPHAPQLLVVSTGVSQP